MRFFNVCFLIQGMCIARVPRNGRNFEYVSGECTTTTTTTIIIIIIIIVIINNTGSNGINGCEE